MFRDRYRSCVSIKSTMMEFFDDIYVSLVEIVVASTTIIAAMGVGVGRAFQ